jgi:serine/threonine protein kinase
LGSWVWGGIVIAKPGVSAVNCPFCQADNGPGLSTCLLCGSSLTAAGAIRRGSLIAGRYEVLAPVGRGGMGTVFKAHDQTLDEVVALKVLRTDLEEAAETLTRRFRLEIKLARRIRHPNVCAIHDYGEDGGLRFITMEFVDGPNLKEALRDRSTLSQDEAYETVLQILDGLEAIHRVGIVHRDLKTANIMRDGSGTIRLMDFGIAKPAGEESTLAGQALGTPQYVSPEQARGRAADTRSDLYSVGIILFELLTGRVPFKADTPLVTLYMQVHEAPPLDDERLSGPVREVLARALAKEPSDRYATAAEMASAVREASRVAVPTRSAVFIAAKAAPCLVGQLQEETLEGLLRWASAGARTGILEVRRRSLQHGIALRAGRIHSSWSNDPRRSLGQFLIREGLISESELSQALLQQEDTRADQTPRLGSILVARGLLAAEQLRGCLRLKAEETFYDLLLRPEGEFEFRDGAPPPDMPVELDLEVGAVLEEWQRRREQWSRIRARIPTLQTTFRLAGERPVVADPQLRTILVLATEGRTVAEISLHTRRPEIEVASALMDLCERGTLVVHQVGDDAQLAETVGAIQELLAIADQRFRERRYEASAEAYDAVLDLDPLNPAAKRGQLAIEQATEAELAQKAILLSRVPRLQMELAALARTDVDAKEAFILSRINGEWDVQSILKVCPLGEDEVLLAFSRLVGRGIVALGEQRKS